MSKHTEKPDIHKFRIKGRNLVFDVGSLTFLEVDDLAFKILDSYGLEDRQNLIDSYKKKYPRQLINEVLDDLDYLEENGLFQPWKKFEIIGPQENNYSLKNIVLHVANACNMRCKYCYAGDGNYGYQNEPFMSKKIAKKAIDFLIKNSGKTKKYSIIFFGGEPLLNKELIQYVVSICKKYEKSKKKIFNFSITTNGTLLSEDIIEFFNKYKFSVVISMDGSKESQDMLRPLTNLHKSSWDFIKPKILNFLKSREGNATARMTVTSANNKIFKEIQKIGELGFKRVVFALVRSFNQALNLSPKDYKILTEEFFLLAENYLKNMGIKRKPTKLKNLSKCLLDIHLKKRKSKICGAASGMVAIDPLGNIFPCQRFVGMETYKLGNIMDQQLKFQIKKEFMISCQKELIGCEKCWVRHFCSGGCYNDLLKFKNHTTHTKNPEECHFIRSQYEIAMYIYMILMEEQPEIIKNFDKRV